jgi:hypothetical protein
MPGSSVLFGDRFGSGIEAAGGWLFVGAPNDQDFPGLIDPREGIDPNFPQPFLFAGQVHVYRLQGDAWVYAQTLTSPDPGTYGAFGARTQSSHIALDSKGKTVVIGQENNFAGGKGQLHSAGGRDFADDGESAQGYIFVYQAIGSSGKFFELPGDDGLDAAGGVVAVADPCTTGVAGPLAGSVSIYRVTGSGPLVFEATIEGDESDLVLGTNFLGSRHTLAVSDSGGRIATATARGRSTAHGPSIRADARGRGRARLRVRRHLLVRGIEPDLAHAGEHLFSPVRRYGVLPRR